MDCLIRTSDVNTDWLEAATAQEIVNWAADCFGSEVSLACSFGAEDVVLVDMLSRAPRGPRAFVLDTGRLHEETYEVMERCRERYGIEFDVFFPNTISVQDLLRSKGPTSFYGSVFDRKECCNVRKVEPLQRALADRRAWFTGLRREQAVTRTRLQRAERDDTHGGILKISPLADWSEREVWAYIHEHSVPYNRLHDQGFPSIGCAPCTRAIAPGEDVRAGRWWWETPEQKECGLHARS